MKHMKKIASFLLAAIMVLAVATTVFAADKPTITAPAGSTHTYKVYQIFTGDLSGSVLSNVKWGKNGTGTKDETVSDTILNALTALNSVTVDATKLTEIEKYVNLAGAEYGTVTAGRPLEVDPGYYLMEISPVQRRRLRIPTILTVLPVVGRILQIMTSMMRSLIS